MKQRKIIRIIFPELQRRLVAVALACIGASVVIGVCTVALAFNGMATSLPNDGDLLMERMPRMLMISAGISLAFALPAFLMIALSMTMPLMGVLYRLRRFLQDTVSGEETHPCTLRANDPLKELCDLLNEATAEQRRKNGAASPENASTSQAA